MDLEMLNNLPPNHNPDAQSVTFAQIIADVYTSENISANICVRNAKKFKNFSTANFIVFFCGILSTANIFGNICVKNTVKKCSIFSTANIIVFFAVIKAPQIFT